MRDIKLISIALLFASTTNAALPPEAQAILNQLPEKALTVPLVLGRAADVSDSFKDVKAQKLLIPVAEMSAESVFAPKLSALAGHFDDRREVAIQQFSPITTSGFQYKLSVDKYFSSGTATSLSLQHNYTDLDFSAFNRAPYYESVVGLRVSQNLIQDAFGSASRAQLRSARLSSKAQGSRAESNLEQWTLNMLGQFYQAWLSQRTLQIAEERLQGRAQLLRATRLKERRGTAEAPDRLQVESVQLQARNLRDDAAQDLSDKWRILILTLKLPAEWMNIEPQLIPIRLDDPLKMAEQACVAFRNTGVPSEESADVRMNRYLSQASNEFLQARSSLTRPNLSLSAEVKFNGIDGSAEESLSESFGTDSPYWFAGLTLSWPLGLEAEKSAAVQAYADRLRSEAMFQSSKDNLRINWLNGCANFDRLTKARELAAEAVAKLRQRERLEEKRFQLGRIPVFNYIQAGDDASGAQLSLSQMEIALRMAAWQLIKLNNQIPSTLSAWINEKSGRSVQ